eukprot:7385155-Prymnesium_polylepis.2
MSPHLSKRCTAPRSTVLVKFDEPAARRPIQQRSVSQHLGHYRIAHEIDQLLGQLFRLPSVGIVVREKSQRANTKVLGTRAHLCLLLDLWEAGTDKLALIQLFGDVVCTARWIGDDHRAKLLCLRQPPGGGAQLPLLLACERLADGERGALGE